MKNVLYENDIKMTVINIVHIHLMLVRILASPPSSVLARRGFSGGLSSVCRVGVLRGNSRYTTNRKQTLFD